MKTSKLRDPSTPNPGGKPGVTKIKGSPTSWDRIGPKSWGGKVVGDKIFSKQGYTSHGNQRGR